MLVSWGARLLYIGPALPAPGKSVAVLALALDRPKGSALWGSTVVAAEHLPLPACSGDEVAYLYIDASSHDLDVLRSACQEQTTDGGKGLWAEDRIISLLAGMQRSARGWEAIRVQLGELLGIDRPVFDRRVATARDALAREPGITAASVALDVAMSPSYFQHVFKRATGLSFRRYATWMRLRHAISVGGEGDLGLAFKEVLGMSQCDILPGTVKLLSAL